MVNDTLDKLARALTFVTLTADHRFCDRLRHIPRAGRGANQAGGKVRPAMLVLAVGGVLSAARRVTYGELSAVNPKAGGLLFIFAIALGRACVSVRLDSIFAMKRRHRCNAGGCLQYDAYRR